MEGFSAFAAVAALFALRCVVPLVATLAIGYGMGRLYDAWRAQPEVELEADRNVEGQIASPAGKPCWEIRGCDPAAVERCTSKTRPGVPCWLTRLKAAGSLPIACNTCPVLAQVAVGR